MPDYEQIAASISSEEVEIRAEYIQRAQRDFFPVDHPKYQGLAEAKGYSQEHARISKTRYTHEAMIDVILENPDIKQNELAKRFDKSTPWISRIIGSDAFQAALAKRRDELTDPFLIATIEERFRGLAYQSLDIISEKLEASKNVDLALKSLDVSAKVLGFGARAGGQQNNTQFIIQLPPKAANAHDWASEHSPMKQIESS